MDEDNNNDNNNDNEDNVSATNIHHTTAPPSPKMQDG